MNRNTIAAALLLTLPAVGTATWAQQPSTPVATAASPAPAVEEPNNATTPAPRAAEKPIADANASPYDYQSSEEISEDLSVSFPVDI